MPTTTAFAIASRSRKNEPGPGGTAEKFRRYWSDKRGSSHRGDTPEFSRGYAAEIRNLFPARELEHILEIGCGDGSAFSYLDVPVGSYKGVDFSLHFLEIFRARCPGVDLICAEGSSYGESNRRFDVIFSNGVIQHFDPEMLDRHLRNARRMMHSESVLILGSVPDGGHRRLFESGAYAARKEPFMRASLRQLKAAIRRSVGIDYWGFWYTHDQIAALARRNGFRLRVVQSKVQTYRFHAVLLPDISRVSDVRESVSANRISQASSGGPRTDDRLPSPRLGLRSPSPCR